MKKIFLLPSLVLMLMAMFFLNACQKQEALITFPDKVKPPPTVNPPVEPPPLSEDLKNVQFLFNDAELHTSMIARKSFGEVKQPSGSYANGFDLVIRLDDNAEAYGYQQLQIRLPLNENGQLVKGTYTIKDNQVTEGGNIDVQYSKGIFTEVFPDAAFSTDKSSYNFNLSLRIEEYDNAEHSIAGVIDSLRINLIADTSRHITIKNAGFHFFYDFLELSIGDEIVYEAATNPYSIWFPRTSGGEQKVISVSGEKLYPFSQNAPFKPGQLIFGLEFTELQETFTGTTELPVSPFLSNLFLLRPEEYTEINGKPLYGIIPSGNYTCRFAKSPKIDIAGGMEITFDNGKKLMDEYYDYEADPVSGVYHPQEFIEGVEYKVKCAFYQKKL